MGEDRGVSEPRYVIVNADDFGQSEGVNRGVIHAHEHGIVTSASILVRHAGAETAAAYAREHHELSTGLHLDFGEWAARNGRWVELYSVPASTPEEIATEVAMQLETFRQLVGADPTHLDSHQHAHHDEPLHSIVQKLAAELGVPLRGFDEHVSYRGDFYGQHDGKPWPDGIRAEALVSLLEGLEAGVTEIGCHPGFADDLDSMYRDERALEVEALCDPRVREVFDGGGLTLCSFRELEDLA
jgi:chitin disaccharide deacetylase